MQHFGKLYVLMIETVRCQVDHDIDQLQARNLIRLIRIDMIPPSPLILVIKTQDMISVLQQKSPTSQIISSFIQILPDCRKTEVPRAELSCCMKDRNCSIPELLDEGLVVNVDDSVLRFSIPECGRLVHNLIQGRVELISFIKRRKQKTSRLLSAVSKIKLKKSTLTSEFILQDLLALGVLERSWNGLPKASSDPVIVIGDESIL